MSAKTTDEVKEEIKYQTIAEFLEGTPPNQVIRISDLSIWKENSHGRYSYAMHTPEIQLHCGDEKCNGVRFFRCISEDEGISEEEVIAERGVYRFLYVTYRCSNCQDSKKYFSLAASLDAASKPHGEYYRGKCYKFGELPIYGPPVSSKLITLIGPDRDAFLKGRTCENQGLGVAAFIYYRRVVENQKHRILGEIIKVSTRIGVPEDNIEKLKSAVTETQFSKALDMAKDAIPESLLINGHSPISLLHSALSEGVHSLTDAECLELAGSVRVVLGELSDRLSQALKDEAVLTKALATLMNKEKR